MLLVPGMYWVLTLPGGWNQCNTRSISTCTLTSSTRAYSSIQCSVVTAAAAYKSHAGGDEEAKGVERFAQVPNTPTPGHVIRHLKGTRYLQTAFPPPPLTPIKASHQKQPKKLPRHDQLHAPIKAPTKLYFPTPLLQLFLLIIPRSDPLGKK